MVEFNTAYYSPMDRKYHESVEMEPTAKANIEEPIIPMIELGTTVPETDPTGRFKNMIQNVQANIRRGAGRIQLVLSTAANSPMGGRPKAYGPEVREQMREVFKANEAILTGIEMPTNSINNLSGFDGKTLSEEMRRNNLDEIRDAIKFAADVAQGGGVDLVSFEFPRPLFDAEWNKADPKTGQKLFQETQEPIVWLVDTKTGGLKQIGLSSVEQMPVALDRETGGRFVWDIERSAFVLEKDGRIVMKDGEPVIKDTLQPMKWEDYVNIAKKEGKTPEEIFIAEMHSSDKQQALGMAAFHEKQAEGYNNNIRQIRTAIEHGRYNKDTKQFVPLSEEEKDQLRPELKRAEAQYQAELGNIASYKIQAQRIEQDVLRMKPLKQFAKQKAIAGYAEAGAMAMLETHNNRHAERPVHVGPEIGWPDYYGGHPAEFAELITKARERMVEVLTSKTLDGEPNPYFQPSISKKEAEQEAKMHIKGCFDTSHMGMWLKHFKPELPWDQRVKEFNNWYMEEIKKLAKSDMVGTIQVVNSMSAAHGHNPPGQGIFPVVAAAREFKRQGFKGYIVSEGHDEEKFDEGRILVETWRAFNAPFESKYGPGMRPQGFNDVQSGYAGRQYAPRQMFGSYTPPFGEYKPWSEIPFE